MTAPPEPSEAVPAGDRYPSKPAYERLLDELIPTRPPRPEYRPWTPEEQARHRADLLEALDGWHYRKPDTGGPDLRLVTDTDTDAA